MSNPLNPQDKQRLLERYRERIATHGVTFDSMCSGSPEKQWVRHSVHVDALRNPNPSILDIGCGLGQFYVHLQTRQIACQYTGYDIVDEYISQCQTLYPESHFEARNIFEQGIDGMYDTVVMSQVLNNRYQDSDNMQVMAQALQLAFDHTQVSVSVDMMSSFVDFQSNELYYYNPADILAIARKITKRVVIRHDYRPFEFCVQLFHEQVDGYVG
jgi:SAM-dependent methyltransferase